MAVVGHWASLAEAEKLTQSMMLKGIIQTVIEGGQLVPRMPVKQVNGKDLVYNREKSWTASDGAEFVDIREQITWNSDADLDQITTPLKRVARQDALDNFVADTYTNINDYRATMIQQLVKRATRFVEDKLIYGDVTYGSAKEFDGLHAMAEENTGNLDIDEGEGALALSNLRLLLTAMKIHTLGKDNVILLVPSQIADRIDAGYAEGGLVRSGVTHHMLQASSMLGEAGQEITMFRGVPIVRSDFLVAEQANTGVGSDIRAKNTSGTEMFTIFGIRFGQTEDGGVALLFGGAGRDVGEVFKRTSFPVLEDYDSGGERVVSYLAPTLGAQHSLGRIYDITDAEVTP